MVQCCSILHATSQSFHPSSGSTCTLPTSTNPLHLPQASIRHNIPQTTAVVYSRNQLASFPGHRRNGMETSVSSNCFFRCQKVGSTNQISKHDHMTPVKTVVSCVGISHAHSIPITNFSWSLNHASAGISHNGFCLNDFRLTMLQQTEKGSAVLGSWKYHVH